MRNENGDFIYICDTCKIVKNDFKRCSCGGIMRSPCERLECNEPGYKPIYAFGYLATMCETHYKQASQQDKDDAVKFRYAEG